MAASSSIGGTAGGVLQRDGLLLLDQQLCVGKYPYFLAADGYMLFFAVARRSGIVRGERAFGETLNSPSAAISE